MAWEFVIDRRATWFLTLLQTGDSGGAPPGNTQETHTRIGALIHARWAILAFHKEEHTRVAIGADHAGYPLKEYLLRSLGDEHDLVDIGTHSTNPVDYPDFAAAVGETVRNGDAERGIVVCGSGAGAAITANKLTGIRAALAHDHYTAHQAVEHDDANVLCLGGRVIGEDVAIDLVRTFLGATFSGELRHVRRVAKISHLEETR